MSTAAKYDIKSENFFNQNLTFIYNIIQTTHLKELSLKTLRDLTIQFSFSALIYKNKLVVTLLNYIHACTVSKSNCD